MRYTNNFYAISAWLLVSAIFVSLIFFSPHGPEIIWTMMSPDHYSGSSGCWFLPSTALWLATELSCSLTGPFLCFARTWTLHTFPVSSLALVWTLFLYNSVRTLFWPADFGGGPGSLWCPYWWAPSPQCASQLRFPDPHRSDSGRWCLGGSIQTPFLGRSGSVFPALSLDFPFPLLNPISHVAGIGRLRFESS